MWGRKWNVWLGIGILGLAGVGLAIAPASADPHKEASEKPFVVKIHADWCSTCKALESTWAEIEQKLGASAHVVLLDVTDEGTRTRAKARARELGIGGFFEEYGSKSGTIGVLAPDGSRVEVLKGVRELAPYRAAVERAAAG